jgi:hypothetical protein
MKLLDRLLCFFKGHDFLHIMGAENEVALCMRCGKEANVSD